MLLSKRLVLMAFVFLLLTLSLSPRLAAEAQDIAEATTDVESTEVIVETEAVPTEQITEEATATEAPTVEPTLEATVETTEIPTEAPTSAPTDEATLEPTEIPVSEPPLFNFSQSVFDAATGIPLEISLSVSDDVGEVRVMAESSAAANVSVTTSAPIETEAPFNTSVTVTYLAPSGYTGTDSLTLTALDTTGNQVSASITVNVLAPVTEATEESVLQEAPQAATTFVVNDTGDAGDATPGDGVCATAGAVCTLRAAIEESNANAGNDTINFNIAGDGPHTIAIASNLPTITQTVTINGYSEPGASAATGSTAATLQIIVTSGDVVVQGFGIAANNSTIQGIVANNLITAVRIEGNNNIIAGNYLGTSAAGTSAVPNEVGILIDASTNNTIGGVNPDARNIISGNSEGGISITGEQSTGNKIQGNYIGANVAGTASLSTGFDVYGVRIVDGASNTTIGGTASNARNLISGVGGTGVLIFGSNNNLVQGNYIGTTVDGTAALPNEIGVSVTLSSGNVIGGTGAGARNLISGNTAYGIVLGVEEESSVPRTGNTVQGNYIGTDVTGASAIANGTDPVAINPAGIFIGGSPNNLIGGTSAGARNLISGNAGYGIFIDGETATGNQVQGNTIGTDAAGIAALANSDQGVYIEDSSNNTIGGITAGARNIISGNELEAITITGATASGNKIQGNYIGLNAAGTARVGTGTGNTTAINITDAPNTVIGGTATGARNVIAGNIQIAGITASGTTIQGNYIGTDATGTVLLGRGGSVQLVTGVSNTLIGGTTPAVRNIITGETTVAVLITEANNNQVQGNYIGTDVTGTLPLGNSLIDDPVDDGYGVVLDNADNNTIGGTTPGARNIIAASEFDGVVLQDGSSGNVVQGNTIGTNAAGTTALANEGVGIRISDATGNTIGGNVPGARNLISGNFGGGILIDADTNIVQGNYIGTNAAGNAAINNLDQGITINGDSNIIGGDEASERNLISGNSSYGVFIGDSASANTVSGNYIGVNAAGNQALPNNGGVLLQGDANTVGGDSPGERNLISGNTGDGIFFEAGENNIISGNYIGTDFTGKKDLGNTAGVTISDGNSNTIGGVNPGEENLIAFNDFGISISEVVGADGNRILGNRIFNNGGLGIDLNADGVTLNDDDDPDGGANNSQNFPVITGVTATAIDGTLNSTPGTEFRIELFSNATCDSSGYGEGENFIGTTNVTTDANGDGTFSANITPALKVGSYITATATSVTAGNTSEFSACFVYATGAPRVRATAIYPLNNAIVFTDTPTLQWNAAALAQTYSIELDDNADFSSPLVTLTSTGGNRSFTTPALTDDTKYYWRVRGENPQGNGLFATFAFTVNIDAAPELIRPFDHSFTNDTTPNFVWKRLMGAANYQLRIDDEAACDGSVFQTVTNRSVFMLPAANALPEGTYYWCVLGFDADGNASDLSAVRSFDITLLKTPANGSIFALPATGRVTFSWNRAPGSGVTYRLIVDDDADLSADTVLDVADLNATRYVTAANALGAEDIYYWRVEVTGGTWSVDTPIVWTFGLTELRPVAPTLDTPANGALLDTATPLLNWNEVAGVGSAVITYEIWVDDNANFSSPVVQFLDDDGVTDETVGPLVDGKRYYWKVRAVYDGAVYGPFSQTRNFTVDF
jgi:hypothetical protein